MTTIFDIINNAKNPLNLKPMVLIMDQVIYVRAIEISWRHQELFQDLVLRLGTFHTTSALLSDIGQGFGAARLQDIVINFKVITEGSVEKILHGKHYNRAVGFS